MRRHCAKLLLTPRSKHGQHSLQTSSNWVWY